MNLNFRAVAALCSVAVSFGTGCSGDGGDNQSGGVSPLFSSGGSGGSVIQPYEPTAEDSTPVLSADCTVVLAEDSVKISGKGASVEGSTVTITEGGSYRLIGSGPQRILLDADADISLILDGVEILTHEGAPIESRGAANVKLTLADKSENTLGTEGFAGILSIGDITVNGTGSLYVRAENGVSSEGAVKLCGGGLEFSAEGIGIIGGEYILCHGSAVGVNSGGEGFSSSAGYVSVMSGTLNIVSGGSGMSATQAVFVSGGETSLRCGGGSSAVMFMESGEKYPYGRHGGFSTESGKEFDFGTLASGDGTAPIEKKGISSGGDILISGGGIRIDSADDSISARGNVAIDGGSFDISSGDDAIRAEGNISVTGGTVEVSRSYTALESLSVDILGGELKLSSCRDGIKAAGGNDIGFYSSDSDKSGHYVSISGGSVTIDAGGDGIDAGGTAAISGGEVTVFSAADKCFGSLCYGDSFALSGGTLAAFGSDGLTKAPSMVSGLCLSVAAEIPAGSAVTVTDESGGVLFETVLPKPCTTVIFSSEALVQGEEYSICADGTMIKTVTAAQGLSGDGPSGRGGSSNELHAAESTSGVSA